MKTVYWRIASRGVGFYNIEFWSRSDKSDAITERFVILDEERLRYRFELITGKKKFELVQVKKT